MGGLLGIGGITLVATVIITAIRAAQLVDERFIPLVALGLGAVLGVIWEFINWMPKVNATDRAAQFVAAAVIGLWAGASAAGLTDTAREIAKP